MKLLILVFFFFQTINFIFATSYAKPQKRDVHSDNGKYILKVNPETKVHLLYEFKDMKSSLWSFKKQVWHFPFIVSNSGKTVATVEWQHVSIDSGKHHEYLNAPCITFWNKDGILKQIAFKEIISDPPKTQDVMVGPIGEFWHTWYEKYTSNGETFTLYLTNGGSITYDIDDALMVKMTTGNLLDRQTSHIVLFVTIFILGLIIYLWKTKKPEPENSDSQQL